MNDSIAIYFWHELNFIHKFSENVKKILEKQLNNDLYLSQLKTLLKELKKKIRNQSFNTFKRNIKIQLLNSYTVYESKRYNSSCLNAIIFEIK